MLTLEEVLAFRQQMITLKNRSPEMDIIAPRRCLFELCRSGETYYLKRTFDNKIFYADSGKVFIFVVLTSHPTQVFCVPAFVTNTAEEIHERNFPPAFKLGHTSITRNSPVFYAGELVLEDNELFAWDNLSGHYRPDRDTHTYNFLPPVMHLLPFNKMASSGVDAAFKKAQFQKKILRISSVITDTVMQHL